MQTLRAIAQTVGFLALVSFGTACNSGSDGPGADAETATIDDGSVTALVVHVEAGGLTTSHTETYSRAEYDAMVAARDAQESGEVAESTPSEVVGTADQALISAVSCTNTQALWLYAKANQDAGNGMLCVVGSNGGGFLDLMSYDWAGQVRSIWPGKDSGDIATSKICAQESVCTRWNANGSKKNTGTCASSSSYRYVRMPKGNCVPT